MKVSRIFTIVLLINFTLTMQGCGGSTWYEDFTTAPNLDAWEKQDVFSPYEGELYGSEGLWLDGKRFISPVGFDGDFTMELVINIKPSTIVPMIHIGLYYSTAYPFEWIDIVFLSISHPGVEKTIISEGEPYREITTITGPAGFNIGENNTISLEKSGNRLTVRINGKKHYSFSYTSYDFDTMFPVLSVNQNNDSYSVYINSIKVEFSGNVYTWH